MATASAIEKHAADALSVIGGKGAVLEGWDYWNKYVARIFREDSRIKYSNVHRKGCFPVLNPLIGFKTNGVYSMEYTANDGTTHLFAMKFYRYGIRRDVETLFAIKDGDLTVFREFTAYIDKRIKEITQHRGEDLRIKQAKSKNVTKLYCIGGDQNMLSVEPRPLIMDEAFKVDLWRTVFSVYDKTKVYKKLKLPPFKKVLLAGPPGTGKTITCLNLARSAIDKNIFAVYVSARGIVTPFGRAPSGGDFDNIITAVQAINSYKLPALMVVEELDTYLFNENNKNKILNFLDGLETPFKTIPVALIMTTNRPEDIDPRIIQRRGRINRVFEYRPVNTMDLAKRMAEHYFVDLPEAVHYKEFLGLTGDIIKELSIETRVRRADGDIIKDYPAFIKEFCQGLDTVKSANGVEVR